MNVLWYVMVCLVFFSSSLACSALAENKRLKKEKKEKQEEVIVRRFRSIEA